MDRIPSRFLHFLIVLATILSFTPKIRGQFSFLYTQCSETTYQPNSTYESNLKQVLNSLSTNNRITYGYYNFSAGTPPNRVEATALCRADISVSNCQDCVRQSVAGIQSESNCANQKGAFGYSENCVLFYYNVTIFRRPLTNPAWILRNDQNVSDIPGFNGTIYAFLGRLQNQAAKGDSQLKYAAGNVTVGRNRTLYGQAQCNPDLSRFNCSQCLQELLGNFPGYVTNSSFTAIGARTAGPSCNLRYEMWPFYHKVQAKDPAPAPTAVQVLAPLPAPAVDSPPSTPQTPGHSASYSFTCWDVFNSDCGTCLRNIKKKMPLTHSGSVSLGHCIIQITHNSTSSFPPQLPPHPLLSANASGTGHSATGTSSLGGDARKRKVLSISLSIFVSLLITVFLVFCLWWRILKSKATETQNLDIDDIKDMESLQFDMNTIRRATCNFSITNRLGVGGFGEVYKGVLVDGQEIAVKRLSKSSKQGVAEFKTEVLLVAKLQHKNLVKLLGFCFESNEKILVYEYLQNSSLDKLLLDSGKKLSFDWQMRFKVIVGLTRGLLYLHEDSRLKIIHRDLKPSNILLDNDMTPKISDFGLARLFEAEESEGRTKRIVGTYGYMAPEYAMTGHFSVKSDIYSFGIIVLEIVSGQKHKLLGPPQLEETLLHRAWRLWNEMKSLDLVDSSLGNEYPKEEAKKCIHIGLLCIQESATERPRMTTVVAALNGQSVSLPMPRAPNFFGSNGVNMNVTSAQYRQQTNGNEIEYHHISDKHGRQQIYSGTEHITDLYPR